jgi:hypothetical protein
MVRDLSPFRKLAAVDRGLFNSEIQHEEVMLVSFLLVVVKQAYHSGESKCGFIEIPVDAACGGTMLLK